MIRHRWFMRTVALVLLAIAAGSVGRELFVNEFMATVPVIVILMALGAVKLR